MKNVIPFIDSSGKINFPGDEGDENVGNNHDSTDSDNSMVDLEAEQTADGIELEQRTEARALIADLLTTLQRRNIEPHIWCVELEDIINKFEDFPNL